MDQIKRQFITSLQNRQLIVDEKQLAQFAIYYKELVSWNEKMNLTGITDREQVYFKHFYDSLTVSFFTPLQDVQTLIDVGSGAGFPGLPLKIVFPHLRITIVDSLNKRIQFLQHLIRELGLEGVECRHSRAEDAARDPALRDRFDMATARAVARLNVLTELCLPFVRPGGIFVAMKGAGAEEEISEAGYSIVQLRARLNADHLLHLPVEQASRHLIMITKTGQTPAAYPRKPGTPLKLPLVAKRG